MLDFLFGEKRIKLVDKKQQTTLPLPEVTRVEVIQHSPPFNGRAYVNMNAKDVELQYQDNRRTLKIFIK